MVPNPPVKSVYTAFDIIELLVEQDRANLTTVADELDLPYSTVHDHLSTLKQRGYVRQVDQQYEASLKFLELGGRIRNNLEIFEVAEAELQKVANETGEHTSLMVEEGDFGIYVYIAPGEHLRQVIVPIGTHTPLYVSAPGKAILAHFPIERREAFMKTYTLKQVTENTIADPDNLRDELSTIRSRGHALDYEEGMRGLQGIAKPVISRNDDGVLGAISIYGPSGRANMEFLKGEALKSLERAANVIEHEMSTRSTER
jgi:DNA-binding IclR family transcriptional regulator